MVGCKIEYKHAQRPSPARAYQWLRLPGCSCQVLLADQLVVMTLLRKKVLQNRHN